MTFFPLKFNLFYDAFAYALQHPLNYYVVKFYAFVAFLFVSGIFATYSNYLNETKMQFFAFDTIDFGTFFCRACRVCLGLPLVYSPPFPLPFALLSSTTNI